MVSGNVSLMDFLDSIKVVLVGTTHPGNIGATARAIKTMGLSKLDLVCPKEFPSNEATYRSKAAKDILEKASIHETLFESVKGCEMVIGTSARNRKVPWPVLYPKNASKEINVAFEKFSFDNGAFKGLILGLKRILRCHPIKFLGGGDGLDPAPNLKRRKK